LKAHEEVKKEEIKEIKKFNEIKKVEQPKEEYVESIWLEFIKSYVGKNWSRSDIDGKINFENKVTKKQQPTPPKEYFEFFRKKSMMSEMSVKKDFKKDSKIDEVKKDSKIDEVKTVEIKEDIKKDDVKKEEIKKVEEVKKEVPKMQIQMMNKNILSEMENKRNKSNIGNNPKDEVKINETKLEEIIKVEELKKLEELKNEELKKEEEFKKEALKKEEELKKKMNLGKN